MAGFQVITKAGIRLHKNVHACDRGYLPSKMPCTSLVCGSLERDTLSWGPRRTTGHRVLTTRPSLRKLRLGNATASTDTSRLAQPLGGGVPRKGASHSGALLSIPGFIEIREQARTGGAGRGGDQAGATKIDRYCSIFTVNITLKPDDLTREYRSLRAEYPNGHLVSLCCLCG